MFVNFSNHPSASWSPEQFGAAAAFGEVKDVPFPNVPPAASEKEVEAMAKACVESILACSPDCVMCSGEFTLCFAVVKALQEQGIPCVCACTDRKVEVQKDADGNVRKTSVFRFVKFRKYG